MNRVALVTGAARGIGAATTLALVAQGWHIAAVDRCSDDHRLAYPMGTRSELDAVVGEANRLGGPGAAVAFVADVCDEAAIAEVVRATEANFGGIDAVLAVAGVIAGGVPIWEQPEAELRAVIDVDLLGVITLARVAVPALLRQPIPRSGRFIAVSSVAATRGLPMLAAYCAAKAGVLGLVRALATELRSTGVTANAINPGSTRTEILDESARLYGLQSREEFAATQPIERLIEPREIAAALVWLAGTESSAVTGASLAVDGGLGL